MTVARIKHRGTVGPEAAQRIVSAVATATEKTATAPTPWLASSAGEIVISGAVRDACELILRATSSPTVPLCLIPAARYSAPDANRQGEAS
jgi:hypothetical protein